jgi:ABC-type transporter Mla subunit MlaD
MSDTGAGFGDIFALLGAPNPFKEATRTLDQLRRAIDEFLNSVENFNRTMASLNETAERVNRLLDDVEQPIRVVMPQVTRSIKAADAMMNQLSGPIERVAPGLSRLADTLNSPVVTGLPTDLTEAVAALREMARHMQPLTQFAESASTMFGFRSLLPGTARPPAPAAPPPAEPSRPHSTRVTTVLFEKPAAESAAPVKKATTAKKVATRTTGTTKKAAPRAAKKATTAKATAARKSGGSKATKKAPAKRSGSSGRKRT